MQGNVFCMLTLVTLATASIHDPAEVNIIPTDRHSRSFNVPIIGSLFGKEEPVIPHLGTHPLWKVHKYHGISLQPVPIPEENLAIPYSLPPTVPGEPPSIINVPDPNYDIKGTVALPPNQYDAPETPPTGFYPASNPASGTYPPSSPYPSPTLQSAPYPPSGPYPSAPGPSEPGLYPPSSPYPAASLQSGPYPPSSPYPSASLQSGPYPPSNPYPSASSQSGPYPPSSPPVSYSSVHNVQSSVEPRVPPPDTAHASLPEISSSTGDSSHIVDALTNLATIFAVGSDEDKITSLFELQGVLPPAVIQKLRQYASTPEGRARISALLGIAANAKKLKVGAAHSVQGLFQKFFGGAGGSTKVALQSATYTNIPNNYPATQGVFNSYKAVGTGISGSSLPTLPDAPPLPKIPGLQSLPPAPELPHINLPEPVAKEPVGNYVSISLPETYEVPQSYGVPEPTYGVPAETYGAPVESSYNVQPAQSYGASAETYSVPSQTYGAPSSTYSAPDTTYNTPVVPSTSYGDPIGPAYPYQPSSRSSESEASYHQSSKQTYDTSIDSSSSGSEVHEQVQARTKEPKEQAEHNSTLPLKTTKLQRIQDSQVFQAEDLRMYLDTQHPAAQDSSYHTVDDQQSDEIYSEDGEE